MPLIIWRCMALYYIVLFREVETIWHNLGMFAVDWQPIAFEVYQQERLPGTARALGLARILFSWAGASPAMGDRETFQATDDLETLCSTNCGLGRAIARHRARIRPSAHPIQLRWDSRCRCIQQWVIRSKYLQWIGNQLWIGEQANVDCQEEQLWISKSNCQAPRAH